MQGGKLSATAFLRLAMAQIIKKQPKTIKAKVARFRDHFKVSPSTCSDIYEAILPHIADTTLPFTYKPIYLLYTLYFLYRYPVERVFAVHMKTSRDTLRRVIWPTVIAMSKWCQQLVSVAMERLVFIIHCSFLTTERLFLPVQRWFARRLNGKTVL